MGRHFRVGLARVTAKNKTFLGNDLKGGSPKSDGAFHRNRRNENTQGEAEEADGQWMDPPEKVQEKMK